MNIVQAKEEIKRTVQIYLKKDEYGEYIIPYMKQRPIFLIGTPGIGKTAIVEQIAQEMDIGMIAYSMTHHTRQSAIGLPYITTHTYGKKETRISEYTMSEIIASVYKIIEQSGRTNGILFLDEINCVSETLAPSILQFLQYKTFGNYMLPEGWIIVSAGNPPEYNRAVREFDVATRDRLKCINIEDDYTVWKRYAYNCGIHSSILSFLEVNQPSFYTIRMTADGAQYATARGWEDLSFAMKLYEEESFPIDLSLISQYITDIDIARKFTVFYDLYIKHKKGYQIEKILSGKPGKAVLKRARKAAFDERIAVTEMLCESLNSEFSAVLEAQSILEQTAVILRQAKQALADGVSSSEELLIMIDSLIQKTQKEEQSRDEANASSKTQRRIQTESKAMIDEYARILKSETSAKKGFTEIRKSFEKKAQSQAERMDEVGSMLENVFSFIEQVWISGRELMYFMSVLTAGQNSSKFITKHGSDGYSRHNEKMLVYDVKESLRDQISETNREEDLL